MFQRTTKYYANASSLKILQTYKVPGLFLLNIKIITNIPHLLAQSMDAPCHPGSPMVFSKALVHSGFPNGVSVTCFHQEILNDTPTWGPGTCWCGCYRDRSLLPSVALQGLILSSFQNLTHNNHQTKWFSKQSRRWGEHAENNGKPSNSHPPSMSAQLHVHIKWPLPAGSTPAPPCPQTEKVKYLKLAAQKLNVLPFLPWPWSLVFITRHLPYFKNHALHCAKGVANNILNCFLYQNPHLRSHSTKIRLLLAITLKDYPESTWETPKTRALGIHFHIP